MKFGPVSLDAAAGKILGHNITRPDGRRALRKGKPLTGEDLALLRALGRETVYVAQLEAGDVVEDSAAARIAAAVMGPGLRLSGPSTGRANLYSEQLGLLRVSVPRLTQLNLLAGITLATLPANTALRAGKMAATLKVLPYAVPEATVIAGEQIALADGPILWLDPIPARKVGLILSGSPAGRERTVRTFQNALHERLAALDATIAEIAYVTLDDESGEKELAEQLGHQHARGRELIILAGETAIMDRHDIAPRAVERAGGEVTCYGAPVDPGNLLMLGYLQGIPVLGAPGCARSPKDNIVDLVLPRLLAGDRLTKAEIVAWGHGGLLEDIPERPVPRSRLA
jgi:molybdenum cofactor cytidylyltransferase